MGKYGFQYCTERVNLLNEMAKPSIWKKMENLESGEDLKMKYAAFEKLYKQIRNSLKGKGEVQRLALDYTISMLYDRYIPGSVIYQMAKEFIEKDPEKYEKWQERMGKNKGTKYAAQQAKPRKEYFLSILVKDNIDYAISEEFREKILDPENIEEFVGSIQGRDASKISGVADFEKKRKEGEYGVDLKTYYKEQHEGKELAKKINKITRELSKGDQTDDNETNDTLTPDQYYAQAVYDELATILRQQDEIEPSESGEKSIWDREENEPTNKTQSQWRYHFAKKIHSKDLNDLINYIDNKIDQGVGITDEVLNKLGDIFGQKSPILKQLVQYLIVVGNSETSMRNDSDESEDYPGYSARALAKVLDTPEKEKVFDNWYNLYKNHQKKSFGDIRKAAQSFMDQRESENEPQQDETPENEVEQDPIDAEIEKLSQQVYNSDNIKEIKKLKRQIEELQKQKEEDSDTDTVNEGVMSYMTEQFVKDKRTKKREVIYEDKKWRKPINYAHWIAMNKD